jgi:hypothetical protein
VWELFDQADSLLLALGETGPPDTLAFYHPRFHLKTPFFGTDAVMREALGRPAWRKFFITRIREPLHESTAAGARCGSGRRSTSMCLVSGEAALVGAGDMLLLSTVGVEWLDDVPQLDRAFPPKAEPAVEAARGAEPLF